MAKFSFFNLCPEEIALQLQLSEILNRNLPQGLPQRLEAVRTRNDRLKDITPEQDQYALKTGIHAAEQIYNKFVKLQCSRLPEKTKTETYNHLYEQFIEQMESIKANQKYHPILSGALESRLWGLESNRNSMFFALANSFELDKKKERKNTNHAPQAEKPHYAKLFTPQAKHQHVIHQPCSRGFKR